VKPPPVQKPGFAIGLPHFGISVWPDAPIRPSGGGTSHPIPALSAHTEISMRSILALPVGGLLVIVGGLFVAPEQGTAARISASLFAQGSAPAPAALPQRTINLTEEDRHTIREIVLKDANVHKETANVKVAIGDKVPSNVTTYEFPAFALTKVPALKAHRYFVKDDQVVIVDTGDGVNSGKVADIVKDK
jgi:hypothetical protein